MSSGDEIDRQQGGAHDVGVLDREEEDSEVDELEVARALGCTVEQLRGDDEAMEAAPASVQPPAEGMASARRQSLFDALAAAAMRAGGFEDAQAMRDELRRRVASMQPNITPRNDSTSVPRLERGQRNQVTDEHVRTMASMQYSLSFAPKTVHTQIWCAWWWWPEEIAKLMEDIRFYGWGVGSLQNAGVATDGHNDGARGYLRRLDWVGRIGEWHKGQALTPIGLQAFANFLDMPESRVPSGLKQVPYLSELMSTTFVGLCAYLPISYVVCCCHQRYVLTSVHVILSS